MEVRMSGEVGGVRASNNFSPITMECDAYRLPVRGELPFGLNGSLYRNGPNPQFDSPGAHWFVGDGMLHAFSLENGKASYRNRWVRTPKWLAEHDAGRALFGGWGALKADAPPATVRDGGAANTNIVWHGGRLLALEEAHLPTEVDPRSLATRGYCNFDRAVAGPFTAHPKIDPKTGEMIFFGYNAAGAFTNAMSYGVIAGDGVVTRFERFETPYASMAHDFIVTERHVLFPILPLTGSMDRAKSGLPPYAWEPDKGAYVGVLARGAPVSDVRWFRGEACYVFHVLNAWEEGERIIADVMQFEEPPLFTRPDGTPTDREKSRARLTRWTFDLAANTDVFERRVLDDLPGEFPRIDDRRAGRPNRHGWFACASPAGAQRGFFDGVAHIGPGGARTAFFLSEGDAISEPVFAPRSADAAEGDGWLLAVVWRGAENRSDLAIFHATDIGLGPIGLVELSHRVPFGFHGNWVEAA
jgi:carotenoid cleavage dioxygenase-like enzyme